MEQYEVLVAIIERGSLSAAAKRLNRSLQSVSRALTALETDLGTELIRRTTRRLQPTPAGMILYERLRTALKEIGDARLQVKSEKTKINGLFRIGASVLFAPKFVVPCATAFMNRFPEVSIDLVLNDAVVDLIEHRLDVAIRIGDLGAISLRSKKIAELRRVLVAAPSYLARHGVPRDPDDLASHLCVVRTFGPEGDAWPLSVDGVVVRTQVKGAFRCSDAAGANAATILGAGIGLAPLWQVRQDLDEGRLELVLPQCEPPPIRVSAVWPGSLETPARTQLFVEMVSNRLAGERV
ncbi:LysR family transcriptional regulator [Methylobacterium sp. WSM2598]|uniref:LysR family transcriptional regulator n=1 Tax=Methylobacterium sp. WSM2598 TaxID=398261 RepID=UPI0018E01DD3|nr:LysR family transcriptional regulator [Methylobacterium sp. WSM2598]